MTMDWKFSGAAVVGSKVVFAPLDADKVGVYDAATETFSSSVSTGSSTMDYKFSGAAVVQEARILARVVTCLILSTDRCTHKLHVSIHVY